MEGPGYRAYVDKTVGQFVAAAKQRSHWIYQSAGKTWFTPEEFQEFYNKSPALLKQNWLDHYKIMDPLQAVWAADAILNRTLEKRAQFVKRVTDYYFIKTH